MSLSLSSRRRYQTPAASQHPVPSPVPAPAPVRKQHSLIEPSVGHHAPSRYTAQQRGYLSRGLSVGRSIESIRQKLYPSSQALARQASLAAEEPAASARLAQRLAPELGVRLREKPLVAWSSTTSLQLKSSLPAGDTGHAQRLQAEQKKEAQAKLDNDKADKNRINLNIVLAQTIRATNEQEPLPSDTECASSELSKETAAGGAAGGAAGAAEPVAQLDTVSCALTVQRRPPLVRAMSAPVRLDESSKSGGILSAAQKRSQQKLRRRKIFTRAASSVAGPAAAAAAAASVNPLLSTEESKKPLSRTRSVIAPDVITLVSLLSSEGSDSEREENSAASTPTGDKQTPGQAPGQRSPQRRAPLLRKTGKSVSFQDSYPPTFQLASKEYSHMIRRGSIAPLAARIRANRPPTAPPVSIFLSEASGKDEPSRAEPAEEAKKENNAANCNVQSSVAVAAAATPPPPPPAQPEYNFPLYVCSIKERECWKLHQKMCAKGVSVSYETVLRGMLTPTEFRHYQKQREHEETKAAQEAAEAEAEAEAAAAAQENTKKTTTTPPTAIERLSESLLQGSSSK